MLKHQSLQIVLLRTPFTCMDNQSPSRYVTPRFKPFSNKLFIDINQSHFHHHNASFEERGISINMQISGQRYSVIKPIIKPNCRDVVIEKSKNQKPK